jgi:hypothetical protein
MQNAETINDLVVHSEERKILWKALRERLVQVQSYQVDEYAEAELDDEILSMLFGIRELDQTS